MSYSQELLDTIFKEGKPIPGKNPELIREDKYGNEIHRYDYGKITEFGWEVDHSKPKSRGWN